MPISRITRNSLVYANNIRQNIETRIFGLPLTSGSFYLQNSQSLYLQDLSGTYVLEYASPIALSYNSYYNKFIADRSTQNSSLRTRYYNSESKAATNAGYIIYENTRSIYTQNLPELYLLEYSSTSSLLTDTSSVNSTLRTRYYNSESKAATNAGYILYENTRSVYTQNLPDIYLLESATDFGNSASLSENNSYNLTLTTRYYNSESKSNIAFLGYQNDRTVYLENTSNLFVIEFAGTSSRLTDTGSINSILNTRYYNSESKSNIAFLGYQNDRTVYLENTSNLFVIEFAGTSSRLNDTGSINSTLNTRYYNSESKSTINFLGYQNDRTVYLENTSNLFVVEFSVTSSRLNDTGSINSTLNTRYYISESLATSSFLGYQNDKSIYLENINDRFIIE